MRAKSAVATRQSKKKYFRMAKGYYSNKRSRWRAVIQQVERSMKYAYTGRKDNKTNYRQTWIIRVNAAARECGMSYSRFISGLNKAKIDVNRKVLAELAVTDMAAFKQLAEIAQSSLSLPKQAPSEQAAHE